MERELFRQLYLIVYQMGRSRKSAHVVYADWRIVMVYVWAVLHDRPVCWACDPKHWPQEARGGQWPSASTMSRRLRRETIRSFINDVEAALRRRVSSSPELVFIDAKPLPVGSSSKDPDAAAGYAGGGLGKGYKLHAICNVQRIPLAWCVRPMNENESVVAPQLIRQLPVTRAGILVGDNAYDKNSLYDYAGAYGWQLFAPRRKSTALGHRHHSRWRLIAHLQRSDAWRARLRQLRLQIERFFAHLTGGSPGLHPLPSWVRGLHRVRQWVQMKIIIYLLIRSHVRSLPTA